MLPLKAAMARWRKEKEKKKATCNLQIFYYDIYNKEIFSGKEAIQN